MAKLAWWSGVVAVYGCCVLSGCGSKVVENPATGGASNAGESGSAGTTSSGGKKPADGGSTNGGTIANGGSAGKDPGGKACGARAGNTCAEDEYCAYEAKDLCGRADAQSVCKPRPDGCPDLYAPVCGCDEKTYDNSCFASEAGIGVLSAGACEVPPDPSDCFSPLGHLDRAFAPDGQGCTCDSASAEDACIANLVLSCRDGHWQTVEDAPCEYSYEIYTTESCMAVGGIASPESISCKSGVALGGLDSGGSCCAPGAPLNVVICGGFGGQACKADEYCAYLEGQHCGGTDGSSVCRPRPTSCDDFLEPVCGCDGKTYSNFCYAHLAGTGLLTLEACDQP